jgi:hypothetical protein
MTTPRRRWTPEIIHETLEPIVAELGRFPKPKELAERGLSGLSAAMGRNGGVAEWKAKFDQPVEAVEVPAAVDPIEEHKPASEVTHEDIATHAYYLAQKHPGADPVEVWLAAERELIAV